MIEPGLSDKVVLITGANHGIGAATAMALAAQGAKVFITYFREESSFTNEELVQASIQGVGGRLLYEAHQQQTADGVVQAIQAKGEIATTFEADLACVENIHTVYDLCEERLGPVDVLVNNHTACIMETFDPARVTEEGFGRHLPTADSIDAHFIVNARAYALLMTEYVVRYLGRSARWGRIINLSTDAAHAHVANVSYAASKHAIESYSRSAAAELGQYGITVNIVAPGPIQTGYITPESESDIIVGTPLGGVGEPADIADVVVFLASEQARWVTGQLLYVGGGWRMHQ